MKNTIRNWTVAYATANVATGIALEQILAALRIEYSPIVELRWSLIVGMPILLIISYVYITYRARKTKTNMVLQLIGQTAIFLIPYLWIANHVQR